MAEARVSGPSPVFLISWASPRWMSTSVSFLSSTRSPATTAAPMPLTTYSHDPEDVPELKVLVLHGCSFLHVAISGKRRGLGHRAG